MIPWSLLWRQPPLGRWISARGKLELQEFDGYNNLSLIGRLDRQLVVSRRPFFGVTDFDVVGSLTTPDIALKAPFELPAF